MIQINANGEVGSPPNDKGVWGKRDGADGAAYGIGGFMNTDTTKALFILKPYSSLSL